MFNILPIFFLYRNTLINPVITPISWFQSISHSSCSSFRSSPSKTLKSSHQNYPHFMLNFEIRTPPLFPNILQQPSRMHCEYVEDLALPIQACNRIGRNLTHLKICCNSYTKTRSNEWTQATATYLADIKIEFVDFQNRSSVETDRFTNYLNIRIINLVISIKHYKFKDNNDLSYSLR